MSKAKALVILSPGFAANEDDTTCLTYLQQVVSALQSEMPSVKIIILSFEYPFSTEPYLWKGNRVIPLNGRNRPMPFRLLMWMRVWRELIKLQKEYRLIGILSFWYEQCALIGKWFAKRNRLKHFTWLLGQDARKGNKYVGLLKPLPDELVVLSEFLVKEFEKNYGIKPAHVINVGIDPTLYSEKKSVRDIDILGVGSLIPLKRYDLFIEVIKALKERLPYIRAMLCGTGPEKNKLVQMIHDAGLQGTIILAGEKPYIEILALMQRSKLFIHPSSYEGFGMVCMEALYAGAQVISFCDPKGIPIPHWHIVNDMNAMIALSEELLNSPNLDHSPVLLCTITDTARSVMKLFDQSEMATS